MNWEAIGAVGETVGGIVVIVSILYLARQIRENSRIAKAESQRALLDSTHIWSQLVTTPGLASEFKQALHSYDNLDSDVQARFNFFMWSLANHVESAYRMHRQGLLENDSYLGWMNGLASVIREPGASVWWRDVKHMFGEEFTDAMQTFLDVEDGPKVSSFWKFLEVKPSD